MVEEKTKKVAIIGDPDILLLFRLLGATVFAATREEEARQAIEEVEAKKFHLCLIQQNFYSLLSEKKKKKGKRLWPVFLPFKDYRQAEDLVQEEIRKMIIKATGSDTLFKRGR